MYNVRRLSIVFILIVVSVLLNAQTTFQKTWGGAAIDYAYDVHKSSNGGYFFGGVTSSFANSTTASYIVRTNNNGDTLWTAAYAASNSSCDAQYINDICATSDGGCIAVGGKSVCGNANVAGNIVRFDANGNVLWSKYCSQNEDPYPVIQDNSGNFIVGGYVTGNLNLDIQTSGTPLWA